MTQEASTKGVILIVDDNPNNLSILFDYLTNSGFKAFVALDGESAIEQINHTQPDLILLDVLMQGIDGFETCCRLKANESTQDIPVVFMTALTDTANKVNGFKMGAVDYITKPIQYEEVLSRIETHLTIRNLQKRLQNNNKQLLQAQVQERQKSLQLEQALRELQQTQMQLIQAEKMSSLGRMISGVSHEINNPVSFIYGNLTYANEYIQQLLELVQIYQNTYTNVTSEIDAKRKEIDLDFLKVDLPQVMNSMQVGAERLCKIVLLLRNFSRLQEAELKLVDIHEGIDSTLLLLQHRLESKAERPQIQIFKEYGNLPRVECYASQLNQVFMNILTNAIDALEPAVNYINNPELQSLHMPILLENQQEIIHQQPMIRICTHLEGVNAAIRISDNGLGMTENVSKRLFEPFFTTKPVGSGTGLGLAVSYQIVVEKHKGKLQVNSEAGRGTEFVIQIPLRLSAF